MKYKKGNKHVTHKQISGYRENKRYINIHFTDLPECKEAKYPHDEKSQLDETETVSGLFRAFQSHSHAQHYTLNTYPHKKDKIHTHISIK